MLNSAVLDAGMAGPPRFEQSPEIGVSFIMNDERSDTIGWKVWRLSSDLASLRYRVLLPMLALDERGYRSRIFADSHRSNLDGLHVLVIAKSFKPEDYSLARRATKRGIPVVLDLCDNIFVDGYGKTLWRTSSAQIFLEIVAFANAIVVTTAPLAEIVRCETRGAVPVHVIPDGIETPSKVKQFALGLEEVRPQIRPWARLNRPRKMLLRIYRSGRLNRARKMLLRFHRIRFRLEYLTHIATKMSGKALFKSVVKATWRYLAVVDRPQIATARPARDRDNADRNRKISRTTSRNPIDPSEKRILWFGNHGGPHARFGMLDLLEIKPALEQIAAEFKVCLIVVSNSIEKYQNFIEPLAVPSRYVEWNPAEVERQLELADVVVVPNTKDPFSICKSANRTVLALAHGVPVVATSTPALDALTDCVQLDDFHEGLRTYLSDPKRAAADVARGGQLIESNFCDQVIASNWLAVLRSAAPGFLGKERQPKLLVAVHLIGDLDLALPVLDAAMKRGLPVLACCSTSILSKSPRVAAELKGRSIPIWSIPEDERVLSALRFPAAAQALLTVAETNLGPHKFTRMLTRQAKKAGLFTATLQHGFENVGLTYDDEVHSISRIDFEAERIFLWGSVETLHPRTPRATRDKCVAVGCPKPARVPPADLSGLIAENSCVIGIFENLHWHRYSEEYRQFFVSGICRLVEAFPDVTFLVKPHHAGAWLTARYKGERPNSTNLVIADPSKVEWERYTAPSLLGCMNAVITTPSTVALDAARLGLPVGVVAFDLNLDNYAPLKRLAHPNDWDEFLRLALDAASRPVLVSASEIFIKRVILPGDAAASIVSELIGQRRYEPA